MCDDIDIEEHDVLDNPTIRRIFPDLSIIKKEILQYEEGIISALEAKVQDTDVECNLEAKPVQDDIQSTSNVPVQHEPAEYKAPADSKNSEIAEETSFNHRSEVHQRFKTFLDSLADDVFEDIDFDTVTNLGINCKKFKTEKSSSPLNSRKTVKPRNKANNIIILGSKPSVKCSKKSTTVEKQLKIVLKNISTYLNESNQYCRHCLILFPNVKAKLYHINKIHSLQPSHSVTNKKKRLGLTSSSTKFQCDICSLSLSCRGNLVRHIKTVHKITGLNKSDDVIQKKNSLTLKLKLGESNSSLERSKNGKSSLSAKENVKNTGHACFHCTEIFETSDSLIEHLYNVLTPNKGVSNQSPKKDQTTSESRENIKNKNVNSLIETNDNEKEFTNKSVCNNQNDARIVSDIPKPAELCRSIQTRSKSGRSCDKVEKCQPSQPKIRRKNFAEINDHIEKDDCVEVDNCIENNDFVENDECTKIIDCVENNDCVKKNDTVTDASNHDPRKQMNDNDSDIQEITNTANVEKIIGNWKRVYQCYVCSQCILFYKRYSYHMRDHKVKITSDIEKTPFEPKCKFCSLKLNSVKSYNKHIRRFHREKLRAKIKLEERAFQSILFKCAKCDFFFLSAKAAKSHVEHEEICVDWKCLECEIIFKINDKLSHVKQHSLCKNVTAYVLSESALERVLYKCLKCAIHFSEDEYFLHYKTCDTEMPDSAYCKACDILINKTDMAAHESNHKDNKLQLLDFTFIETDIMVNKVKKPIEKKSSNRFPKFTLTFCHTCKCFIGDLGKTRNAHIQKRCGVINPRMCTKCGLIFTSRGYVSHKMLHDKVENLSLQTYYFYDLKSEKQMRPPIPEYPQCNICEIHFLSKKAIKEHECSMQHYRVCDICKIKLTRAAFKLHINFHTYKLTSCAMYMKECVKFKSDETAPCNINNSFDSAMSMSIENLLPDTSDSNNVYCLYTCIVCNITVDMYDKVIEHCHDHYDYCKRIRIRDYKQMESTEECDISSAITIKYDPFYIRFPNDIWIKHMFANTTEEITKNILEQSLYQFECRFKMEELQPGPRTLVLYKCDICRLYIAPNALYAHAKNACTTVKKYPCPTCGLCFASSSSRTAHENVHHNRPDINIKSYKIVMYNKMEHHLFTKIMVQSRDKFILYQCRNCDCIVDKLLRANHQCQNNEIVKCAHCGLLFCESEFDSHINKHKEFLYFKPENMTVIMFGKLGLQQENKLTPTFHGTVYDLTFYKCVNCGLCLKSKCEISKHSCVPKTSKVQCPKCYLVFLKKELHEHVQLHENNLVLSYDDFNSNIITFDLLTSKVNTTKELEHDSSKLNANKDEICINENINSDTLHKIYKCNCGLHFLEEFNAKKHYYNVCRRQKVSKQSCFKCDLMFSPGELFEHLLKHHTDKNKKFKYDIIYIAEQEGNRKK